MHSLPFLEPLLTQLCFPIPEKVLPPAVTATTVTVSAEAMLCWPNGKGMVLLFWSDGLVPDNSFQLSGKLTVEVRPASQRGLRCLTQD